MAIESLQRALAQGGTLTFDAETISSKKYWRKPAEPLGAIAECVAIALRNIPRAAPAETLDDSTSQTVRAFLKRCGKNKDPRIEGCRKEFLAYKLGIPREALERNQGFESFAKNPPLERYLAEYHHTLVVDGLNIKIVREGGYSPWSHVSKTLNAPQRDPATNQPWLYGPEGVQNKNMFEWGPELKSYKWENPETWGCQHIIEICCCYDPQRPNFIGDHTWLRFKTPDGRLFCVGKYRAYKSNPKQNRQNPLRVQKGYLMSPDVSEFWPIPIKRIGFVITPEQFEAMKAKIEQDKREDALVFQVSDHNCTQYAMSIAKLGGIEFPASQNALHLLSIRYVNPRVAQGFNDVTRAFGVDEVAKRVATVAFNILLFAAGASQIDPACAEQCKEKNIPPHLHSFRDWTDPKRLEVAHPYVLGTCVIPAIEASRDPASF